MRQITLLAVSGLLCIAGCGQPMPPDNPIAENTPATDKPTKPQNKIDFTHPTTAEELKQTYLEAFNAGDTEAIEKMIY